MPSASILERELTDAECPRLRLLHDNVYVRQERIPDKAGRFILPDSVRTGKAVRRGKVLAVGPGRLNKKTGERMPMQVKEGDWVLFPDTWGTCVFAETDPSLLIGPESDKIDGDGLLAEVPPPDPAVME